MKKNSHIIFISVLSILFSSCEKNKTQCTIYDLFPEVEKHYREIFSGQTNNEPRNSSETILNESNCKLVTGETSLFMRKQIAIYHYLYCDKYPIRIIVNLENCSHMYIGDFDPKFGYKNTLISTVQKFFKQNNLKFEDFRQADTLWSEVLMYRYPANGIDEKYYNATVSFETLDSLKFFTKSLWDLPFEKTSVFDSLFSQFAIKIEKYSPDKYLIRLDGSFQSNLRGIFISKENPLDVRIEKVFYQDTDSTRLFNY